MAARRRLSVVQLLPALDGGGVERGTLEIAAALVRAGHRSVVVSAGGRLVERLVHEGSEHIDMPVGRKSFTSLLLVRRLRRLLGALDADIVHARSRLPAWLTWLAWRGMPGERRPHFVTTVHGFYSVGRYSAVMTRGERVIAVSECIREYVLGNYPAVDPARIAVIPRGVDAHAYPRGWRPDEAWLARWRREFPTLSGRRVLTIAARLSPLKGHEDFLDLVARLVADGQPVHGLVVGGPRRPGDDYPQRLRRRIDAEGLPVSFTGIRDDMREIYASSDVVLSLSRQPESFGRSVLEALSLGVPVVGYEHGGVGEVLGRLLPAGRVPVGDTRTAARRVAEFLADRPDIAPVECYALDDMCRATLGVYEEVASR